MRQAQEIVAKLGEGWDPQHRPREIENQGSRHDPVLRGYGAFRDLESAGRGLSPDRSQEPGLADARLARQQEEVAATLEGVGKPSIGQIEQVVAPDEQRAQERRDAAHPPSVPTLDHGASVE